MRGFLEFLIVLAHFCRSYSRLTNYQGPQISVKNGHMFITAYESKNIYFQTDPEAAVLINHIEVLSVLQNAKKASDFMQAHQASYSSLTGRVTSLEQRLLYMPGLNVTPSTDPMLRRLSRRILNVQRSVNTLRNLLDKDECASNPCKNDGRCQDLFDNYVCQCRDGWEGHDCSVDVNECAKFAGTDLGCQNGASCVNKPGTYECLCQTGFVGIHCTRKKADCATGGVELCGHGICVPQNTPLGYKCICDQGWTTDASGRCITDVDECFQKHPSCFSSVGCQNLPGSYTCAPCPLGYTGNGFHCEDMNECEYMNGHCSMNPMVRCINTPGSRICDPCPAGYYGDGVNCVYRGVCNINNGNCHPLAQCRDNPRISSTYVECICPAGYVGNGIGPNGCNPSPYRYNPCASNPCVSGTCTANNATGDYVCHCNRKYTGRNCDILKDPCASNPCLYGGTCISVLDLSFKCTCPRGYTGTRCETQAQACGGQLRGFNGTIKYPELDFESYGTHLSCSWTIETSHDKVLNITFKKFDIEEATDCRKDWIQLHDGANSGAHGLGRFCGKKLPLGGNVVSTHNIFYLWFRSDARVTKGGFELTWTSVDPVCGGDIYTESHGSLRSPGSPGKYPPNRDCYWKISAPLSKRLTFHFYTLEIGNNSKCDGDYLEFYTGLNPGSTVFAKICNSTLPAPFHSIGSNTLIHFHSDAKNSYEGFQLSYAVVEGIPGCGNTYTAESGTIQSLDIPQGTFKTYACEYKILRPINTKLKITFSKFDLVYSQGCRAEYVEIREGPNVDSPLLDRFCNDLPPPLLSYSNQIMIISSTFRMKGGWKLQYESVCLHKFTEASGNFSAQTGSPSDCIYYIERPRGYKIELTLKINSNRGCYFNSVEVRDGDNENSTLIGRYCQNQTEIITSTHNYLRIYNKNKLISFYDANNNVSSFEASYTSTDTGCGGILRDKNGGIISSPTRPSGYYPAKLRCSWVIIAPPSYVVRLTWNSFNVEKSTDCNYDKVLVYDNNTDLGTGDLMGKFCGLTLPYPLQTLSNIMTIVFITDVTIHLDGFVASYNFVPESSTCGGNYYTASGIIKSPRYPKEYTTNQHCTWIITVAPGQQILLNITDFDLEHYKGCRYDYLEIRNGGTSASPLVGKYCGTNIPKQIPSHTNQLFLKFASDPSKNGRGFKITWSSTSTACGGTLTSSRGSITSPMYPEPYYRNTDCTWRITVAAGSRIQLVFSDIDLETHPQCTVDYVEIFDGLERNMKSLGKYCSGGGLPILTSSNQALIIFRSDVAVQGRGFQLHYSTLCYNTLRGFRGVIESPNFYSGYSGERECLWNIIVSDNNKINITFSHISVNRMFTSSNGSCVDDYIEVKALEPDENGASTEPNYVTQEKICTDESPKLITVHSDHAQVHLINKQIGSETSFRLEWQLFGCGGILTHNTGTIMSPNYPKNYPPLIRCEWIIQLDFIYSIEIQFTEVNIERDSSCYYDSVSVYNGFDNSSNLLAKFCHQKKPVTLTSTGNYMYIDFKVDYNYQRSGFIANYSAVPAQCGGHFTASRGNIFTRNYPKNYNRNDSCAWLIDVDEGHSVNLVFTDVGLWHPCTQNYIKVHDGPTAAYPVLVMVCENDKPNDTIHSTFNEMYIEFKGHPFFSTKGFSAKYSKSCGSRITTQGSGLIDINHEEFTEDMVTCTWTIVATDPTKHVTLTVTHTNIYSYYCSDDADDKIKIFNGESIESPLIKSFCGVKVPPPITSDGNALTIHLLNEMDFVATYSVLDSHCGGTYTSDEGYFSTPGYPKRYPSNIQCEWIIQTAPGNHLSLSFIEFDIISSDNCNTDYLEIRRFNSSGKLLGVYCGTNKPENITKEETLWLFYKGSEPDSDSTIRVKGFYAEYAMNRHNELSGPKGVIASPIHHLGYGSYNMFSWQITVAQRMKVMITFKDFYIEADQEECYYDYLEVYDGVDETATLLKTLCGTSIPDPITSSSNIVFLRMSYNSLTAISRFLLEWLEVSSQGSVPSASKVEGCGSSEVIYINSSVKNTTVTSPGYPKGYQTNLNCEWIFSTIPMNHLRFYFVDINLEGSNCYGDYITIFQKHSYDNDWQKMNTVCTMENINEDIVTTDLMKLKFVTNSYFNGTGFKAHIYESCGGSLYDQSGYIIYNETTPRGFECQWNITVRPGRKIALEFVNIDIPKGVGKNCNNYVIIRNGKFSDSPLLGSGKYCGIIAPPRLESTGNYVYIKYKGATLDVNFKIKYKEVSFNCGGKLSLTEFDRSVEIISPNYPDIPAPHTECIWIITSPPGQSLRMDFEERFDLSESNDCSVEYVELRDGGTLYSPLIGRYCKTTAPSTQFSTDNLLFVKFYTDTDEPKNGFKANVSLASCGGTLRSRSGTISTPPLKNGATKHNCTWNFVGPVDHYLTLTVEKISMLKLSACLPSHVITISEPSYSFYSRSYSGKARTIQQICGKTNPPPFNTSSNVATINFVGDSEDQFAISFNTSKSVCGGKLTQSFGVISSPGYPGMSHSYRQCLWTIEVPQGRRVRLNILDLDLGNPQESMTPGLVIYDGPKYLVYLKPGSSRGIYESSSYIMMVRYWSSQNFYHRGFKAIFTSQEPTICEGDFAGNEGVLKQPSPRNESYWCKWVHRATAERSETLALTVTYVTNSTSTGGCKSNLWFLRVTNQDDKGVISYMCQVTEKNYIIRSPFPTTILEAATGRRFQLNFTVSYKVHDCGGIIKGEEGWIESPNYPNKPTASVECVWLLKVDEGQVINITTSALGLGDDCEKSFLSIYNGNLPTHPRIGKYCHNNMPFVISQSNSLWIEYKWDKISTGSGFKIQYQAIEQGCGGIFHDRSRVIQTPNYGKDYPNYAECFWEIRAEVGYSIRLEFIERFHLEESQECANDYVEIWDWKFDEWVSLGRKCGRNTPAPIQSTGDQLKLVFRTNKDISATGFKAKWEWICGGDFEAGKVAHTIYSPGYPVAYPKNLNCVYNIKTKGVTLNIIFEDFELERGSPSCRYDNLTIQGRYYARFISSNQVYCGTNSPSEIRMRNTVTIIFKTDSNISKKGFKFSFKDESCGGEITSEQVIEYAKPLTVRQSRPFFHYYSRTSCKWNVTAPGKKIIVFKVIQLNITYSPTCGDQGIKLYDGLDATRAKLLYALCSFIEDSSPFVVESGKMLITLDAYPNTFGGFKGEILFTHGPAEGCGGFINLTETKTIQSPNLPDLICNWKIIAPRDYQVQIYFTEIRSPTTCSLKNNLTLESCSCSFISVFDGPALNSDMIIKMCKPFSIDTRNYTTTSNGAYIQFFLKGSRSSPFKVKLTPVLSQCGPSVLKVTDKIQTITTPNYPNSYPDGVNCNWALQTSNNNEKIALHFVDFDLVEEDEKICNTNRVEIIEDPRTYSFGIVANEVYHGKRKHVPLVNNDYLARPVFCGRSDLPFDYYSNGGKSVTVRFRSVESQLPKGRGFKLEYSLAGCNRNYTSSQGRITNGIQKSKCVITITVPENRTISLYFLRTQIPFSQNCSQSSLEVRDTGPNGKLLSRTCGFRLPNPQFSYTNKVYITSVYNGNSPPMTMSYFYFDILYTSSENGRGCGGDIYNSKGQISSPFYPDQYRNNSVCTWKIKVPLTQVALKFTHFDIQGSCASTYVKVTTYTLDMPTEHIFCKDDNPAVLRSDYRVEVEYSSTIHNGGIGWLAVFQAVNFDVTDVS